MTKQVNELSKQYLNLCQCFYKLRLTSVQVNASLSSDFTNPNSTGSQTANTLLYSQYSNDTSYSLTSAANLAHAIYAYQSPETFMPSDSFTNSSYVKFFRNWLTKDEPWTFCYIAIVANNSVLDFKKRINKLANALSQMTLLPIKLSKLISKNYGSFTVFNYVISTSPHPQLVLMPLEKKHNKAITFSDLTSCHVLFIGIPVKPIVLGKMPNLNKSDLINLAKPNTEISASSWQKTQTIYQTAIRKIMTIKKVKGQLTNWAQNFNYNLTLTPANVLLIGQMIKNNTLTDLEFKKRQINNLSDLQKEPELIKYLTKFI